MAGVVHARSWNDTYEATLGGGATKNGSADPRQRRRPAGGRVDAGDPAAFKEPSWPRLRFERRNSIALRMALVASGEFDATVAVSRKHDWDVAAGAVIAEEAGARVTDHLGGRTASTSRSRGRGRWSAARRGCTR